MKWPQVLELVNGEEKSVMKKLKLKICLKRTDFTKWHHFIILSFLLSHILFVA
jgi:hypothetical protein